MTAQFAERLTYEGKDAFMFTEPLASYFALTGIQPEFALSHTALWRCYVGTWEIHGGRLYLTALEGKLKDGTPARVEHLFPGFPDRVFAHWFSGDLRLPEGKLIKYVHQGYARVFENDRIISLKKGVVVSIDLIANGVAPASATEEEVPFPRPNRKGRTVSDILHHLGDAS